MIWGSGFITIIIYQIFASASINPPPPSGNFLLLDNTDFLILDGTNLLLL